MGFLGISWVGISVEAFEEAVEFFDQRMGLRLAYRAPHEQVAHFRMENDDLFEVLGLDREHTGLERGMAMAFQVDDLQAVRRQLADTGVRFVTEVESWRDHAWCFFEGPGGQLFQLNQTGYTPAA